MVALSIEILLLVIISVRFIFRIDYFSLPCLPPYQFDVVLITKQHVPVRHDVCNQLAFKRMSCMPHMFCMEPFLNKNLTRFQCAIVSEKLQKIRQ